MEKDISLPEPLKTLLNKLEASSLTNFYGGPGTGKTNLCLLASLECIKKEGKVIYIDTEGGFSLERLKQLTPDYENTLKNIEIVEPKNFKEQGMAIRLLENKNIDLIVLDSAVALYRLEHGENENPAKNKRPNAQLLESNRELSRQISVLSNIARVKQIPVVITTHTFKNWDTKMNEVVGGDSVKYWSKAIVFLEKTGKTSERRAIITKHRSIPEDSSVKFLIVREGIKPSGFKLF